MAVAPEGSREALLFERSELAVSRGARVVVWNEVATLVEPDEEGALVARAAAFARSHGVDLVAAYGVVRSRQPLRYENVYRWFGPEGAQVERYAKHFLPLGEPAIAGTEPLRAYDRPWGRAAGALCYDYDSPSLAREGGFSILRSVRAATSAAIDPHGRFRATLSPWEENDRVLVATVPARQVWTLYSVVGDAPALALALALVVGALAAGHPPRG